MLKTIIAAAALSLVAGSALAQAQTEIVMQYPYPELFTETHKRIAEEFANPSFDLCWSIAPGALCMVSPRHIRLVGSLRRERPGRDQPSTLMFEG